MYSIVYKYKHYIYIYMYIYTCYIMSVARQGATFRPAAGLSLLGLGGLAGKPVMYDSIIMQYVLYYTRI